MNYKIDSKYKLENDVKYWKLDTHRPNSSLPNWRMMSTEVAPIVRPSMSSMQGSGMRRRFAVYRDFGRKYSGVGYTGS